ncbi:hypothetical protein COO60DRAFT_1630120 [Scenedesmus sp. NREL 46B-D3]|nr:hypothetical protein COO60DRAFT_1630120 [Scenedesmus sp. NREL 46B-D3]
MCVCFRSSATFGISQGILCSVRHWPPTTLPPLMWRASRGYIRASRAGPAVGREYAETVGPLVSYLYDIQQALEEQATASDLPENRRKSLAVVVTANRAVLDFLVERHNLLVAIGEFKHDPSLVQALEQGRSGVDGLPITSSHMIHLLEKQASAQVVALTKQSAKASGGPSRSGGGSSNPPA